MTVIAAVSRKICTLADGTLRLTIDIEPKYANEAFQLFGAPESPVAIARIQPQAAIKAAQDETIAADNPKRGLLSQWAALRCTEHVFQAWICHKTLFAVSEIGARNAIYSVCQIESRAELDTNDIAAKAFHRFVREPYAEYIRLHHANEKQPF